MAEQNPTDPDDGDDDGGDQTSEKIYRVNKPPPEMRPKKGTVKEPSYRDLTVEALNRSMDILVRAGKLHGKPPAYEEDQLPDYPRLDQALPVLNARLTVAHKLISDVLKRKTAASAPKPRPGTRPARPADPTVDS